MPKTTFPRILVLRLRFIGDLVLLTPVISSIRKRFPDSEIIVAGEKPGIDLLEHHPKIDQVVALNRFPKGISGQTREFKKIRSQKPDLVIDLFGNPRSAVLTLASGAPVRLGRDYRGRGVVYNWKVPRNQQGETPACWDFHRATCSPLNLPPIDENPRLYFTEQERQQVPASLKDRIGIHLGSTWPSKDWGLDKWGELCGQLLEQGEQLFVTLGPEDDRASAFISESFGEQFPVLKGWPLRKLGAAIESARAFISGDGGILHLAVATGVPVIGIFGPTEKEIWFPYKSRNVRLISEPIWCRPCHLHECSRMDCLRPIEPKHILHELNDILAKGNASKG